MLYAYTCHSAKTTVQSHREQEAESLKGYSKITLQYTYIKRCTAIIGRQVSNRQVKRQNNIDLTQGHITASWRASGEAVRLPQDPCNQPHYDKWKLYGRTCKYKCSRCCPAISIGKAGKVPCSSREGENPSLTHVLA